MNNSSEKRIQNQFGAFCVRVLKNEALHIEKEYAMRAIREKPMQEISESDLNQQSTNDLYFSHEHVIAVQGLPVVIMGDLLAEAILALSDEKREIILLSYYLGKSDREIGKQMRMTKQSIAKKRKKILIELRESLEKEGFEWYVE